MMSSLKLLSITCCCWLLLSINCQLVLSQQEDVAEPEAQQLQLPRPRGRIRIADMQLPQPPPPPPPPMPGHGLGLGPWSSYGVAPGPATSTVHTHIPLLREQTASSTTNEPQVAEGSIQESVIYGNWKPEQQQQQQVHSAEEVSPQPKQRNYGRLEAMLMGLPAAAMDRIDVSGEEFEPQLDQRTASAGYHNPYTLRDSYERVPESRGRWRPATAEVPLPPQPQPQPEIEVIRLNYSDPLLGALAKQINESIETTTMRRQPSTAQTTEDNWMPLPYPYPTHSYESTQPVTGAVSRISRPESFTVSPSPPLESTTFALNWPTDFLDSATASSTQRTIRAGDIDSIDSIDRMDSIDRIDDDVQDQGEDYKYYEDNLSSAQMNSGLSIPESVLPQLPLNITRVGIPYEERNSSDEPTICVPLTVTETASERATPLLVEVERVYCFPLPKVEIRTGNIRPQQVPVSELDETTGGSTTLATEAPPPADGAAMGHSLARTLLVLLCSRFLLHL